VPTICARNHCSVGCSIACFPCVICESEKVRFSALIEDRVVNSVHISMSTRAQMVSVSDHV
jgi:hypothetical protein